jgi:hypothetical protein
VREFQAMAGWRVLELWIIRIRLSIRPSHRLVQCLSPPTQPPSHGTMPPSSCRYRAGTSRSWTLYMRFHLFLQCIVIDTQSSASLASKRAIRKQLEEQTGKQMLARIQDLKGSGVIMGGCCRMARG